VKLGLKFDEVRLSDYTLEWIVEFKRVQQEIVENTGIIEKRIQHMGSTAIKDMPAKPIIDIVVGVDDLNKVDKTLLSGFSQAGFLRLKVERPGEIVLAKFTDDTYKVKTHFIHLVEFEKEIWDNLIFFRDYLNSSEDARKQYIDIKREYVKKSSTGINEYTHYKENFVKNIFAKRTSLT